jgi:hypothetical protein
MKTKIITLSLAALIISAGLAFGQTVKPVKLNQKKFQKCKEFTMEIDPVRTFDSVWVHYDENFSYIDSSLNDRNFIKDPDLKGQTTIVIYRLKRSAKCEEAIAFAEKEGLSFIDAQALAYICTQKKLDTPGNSNGIIAVNKPENLYRGQGRDYIFFKYDYHLVPLVAYSFGHKRLGAGAFGYGCARGNYLIFYKKKAPCEQELSRH